MAADLGDVVSYENTSTPEERARKIETFTGRLRSAGD
jgi:hypothetical protein